MKSKQLKDPTVDCGCYPELDTFWGRIAHKLKEWLIWPIVDRYHRYSERISRSLAFARKGWLNYDFDMASAYDLFDFKLRRLYKALETGHAVQQPEDMEALRKLIKIVRRLSGFNYERKYHRAHDRKWGKLQSKTEPAKLDDKGEPLTYSWISWRSSTENASKKVKNQERKEFLACWTKGEADRCKDIDRLAELLKKHGTNWWD